MFNYNDRESSARLQGEVEKDGNKGRQFLIHDIDVMVWDDGTLTYKRHYYASGKVEGLFPNARVENGALILGIEDMLGLLLERIAPEELADALVGNDEAREALVYALAHTYASPAFTDADRRKWLTEVKSSVHSTQIGQAVDSLTRLEETLRVRSSEAKWRKAEATRYRRLYEWISWQGIEPPGRPQGFFNPDEFDKALRSDQDPAQMETVGQQWQESRDHWRRWLEGQFPFPAEPKAEADEPNEL